MTITVSRFDIIGILLVLCCFAGCVPGKKKLPPRNPKKHPQLKLLASRKHDAAIVLAAEKEKNSSVRLDGNIVALWVQLGNVDLESDDDIVVQTGENEKKRLLLLVGKNDISARHIAVLYPAKNGDGKPTVGVTLTDEGARRMLDLTSNNIGRRIATIIDGRFRGQFMIVAPVGSNALLAGKYSQKEVDSIHNAFNGG